jgi:hypothetical protein
MGSPSLEINYRSELQKYLHTYTSISVREGSATPYLEQLSKKPVVTVLDLTLLLTQKHWNNFSEPPGFSEHLSNFIFVYSLAGPFQNSRLGKNSVLGLADRLRKVHNLKRVIYVGNGKTRLYPKETYIPPEEFPWYFAHAAFVVTDSYHGTIFSLINKTPFYTIQQESNNTRVADLLTSLGLRNRLVSSASEISDIHSEIDWDTVEKKTYRFENTFSGIPYEGSDKHRKYRRGDPCRQSLKQPSPPGSVAVVASVPASVRNTISQWN